MSVHYRIEGNGQPLVLLHGTASSLHTWDGWKDHLQDSFQIIRVDLPAFGLTGPNAQNEYSIPIYVDFLDKLMREIKVGSFYLADNSLGGNIAWNYSIKYPEKIRKLILIDAAGMPLKKIPAAIKIAQNSVGAFLLKSILPRSFIEKSIKEVYFDDTKVTPLLVDRYYELGLREGNRDAFVSRARSNMHVSAPDLSSIQCPTLIMWGKYDEWIFVEDAFIFKDQIQNSYLIIYDKAGHIPMEELPEQTAKDAMAFLFKQ